jgi:hypothetical protein
VNEVLVGAALPLVVCAVIYAARGFRAGWKLLVLGPLAMLVSGVVGVIPDLPRFAGHQALYEKWHHASWCNLCWGHCWIDARPRIDDWAGWPAVAVVVGAAVIGAAFRELWLAERRPS